MRFSVLSSGSKANATYVEAGETSLLIDCGLSCRELERRMSLIGADPAKLSGILVTHEHHDHVAGLERFSKRYQLPIFATRATRNRLPGGYAFERIESGASFSVKQITVTSFTITHDAVDPHGFTLQSAGENFSLVTDLGRVTPLVRDAVRKSHSVLLESNHDKEMLLTCGYSWDLKKRISSTHGHLSNESAGELLRDEFHSELFHVVLGHISANSNTQSLAFESAERFLAERKPKSLRCASVYEPTPLLQVAA